LLFGGALAAGAVAGVHLNLAAVVAAGVAGNVVGSYIAWAIGLYGGQRAWRRWGRYILLRPDDIDRAEGWFDRHGSKAVFFGRLLPIVRTFISLPAGIAKMPPSLWSLHPRRLHSLDLGPGLSRLRRRIGLAARRQRIPRPDLRNRSTMRTRCRRRRRNQMAAALDHDSSRCGNRGTDADAAIANVGTPPSQAPPRRDGDVAADHDNP